MMSAFSMTPSVLATLGMTLALACILSPCDAFLAPNFPTLSRRAVTAAVHTTRMSTASARIPVVFNDDAAVREFIVSRVKEIAKQSIASKGGFSMSIGSGTTVKPLKALKDSDIDFNLVHVFFGNERVCGDTAYKCYSGAEFAEICGIPRDQVHKVPNGGENPELAAEEYEALIKGMPPAVVGHCARTGLPALDLVLLGSGADGHTASLYPGSKQVLQSPSNRLVVPAEGKGGVTFTLDFIQSARNVILSAAKASQAEMVQLALASPSAATNTECPAGMIAAGEGTRVEWLLSPQSAALLP